MKYHYENFIPALPGESVAGTPSAYVLAVGYSGDEPWIVEINPHAMVGRYEDHGFHALRSGAAMAQQPATLPPHFPIRAPPIDPAVLSALRVHRAPRYTSPP